MTAVAEIRRERSFANSSAAVATTTATTGTTRSGVACVSVERFARSRHGHGVHRLLEGFSVELFFFVRSLHTIFHFIDKFSTK